MLLYERERESESLMEIYATKKKAFNILLNFGYHAFIHTHTNTPRALSVAKRQTFLTCLNADKILASTTLFSA